MPRIKDEFTDLKMSPQRRYQLRKKKALQCVICGDTLTTKFHCQYHAEAQRERQRIHQKSIRRYNSKSYRRAAKNTPPTSKTE